jgi:hypothetical protein
MWGGVGCREFLGREELSRCGKFGGDSPAGEAERIGHVSVSKCDRPPRKREMRFAAVIDMPENDFGKTRHINKECVLYQNKYKRPPN